MAPKATTLAVRRLRAMMGLTQDEFAERLTASRRSVTRWERGSVMPSPMARARLKALHQEWRKDHPSEQQTEHNGGPQRRTLSAHRDEGDMSPVSGGVLPSMT